MKTKPILAMVTDAIQPYRVGGKEIRTAELSSQLLDRYEVHIYTMKWWSGPATRVDEGVIFHGVCPCVELYSGGRRSVVQAIVFAIGCLTMLVRRFDVMEADHMPYLHLFVLRCVTWARRRRLVVTWHEVWGLDYWRTYLGAAGLIAYAIEAVSMRLPDRIIAASDQTAERLRKVLGCTAAVSVAPNGVDLQRIRSIAPAGAVVDIVTVGRLLPHKRVDLLLDAVAKVKVARQAVSCRIIGSGPDETRLVRRIQDLGLSDNVEMLTSVTEHDDVFALIKTARAFVLPSEREGFGIAAIEGLACGLPVVTTSAPDNLAQHVVLGAPGGVVCEPNVEKLAKEINEILSSPRTPGRAEGELQEWLAPYAWPVTAERVSEALTGSLRPPAQGREAHVLGGP